MSNMLNAVHKHGLIIAICCKMCNIIAKLYSSDHLRYNYCTI